MENQFRIAEVNELDTDTLIGLVTPCLAVDRWARELVAARPYADVAALLAKAGELAASLSDDEITQALAGHPRIGERTAAGSRSAKEQSGVDDSAAAEFVAANVAYEQRFGHIYLVCASGRGGAELLADLNARMANGPVTELGVVRRELGRIAHLRLAALVGR